MIVRIRPYVFFLIITTAFFLTNYVSAAENEKAGLVSILASLLLSDDLS